MWCLVLKENTYKRHSKQKLLVGPFSSQNFILQQFVWQRVSPLYYIDLHYISEPTNRNGAKISPHPQQTKKKHRKKVFAATNRSSKIQRQMMNQKCVLQQQQATTRLKSGASVIVPRPLPATIEIASPTNFFFFSSTIHFKFEGHSQFLASWFFVCVCSRWPPLLQILIVVHLLYIKLNIFSTVGSEPGSRRRVSRREEQNHQLELVHIQHKKNLNKINI
jgi:hypothetical protein